MNFFSSVGINVHNIKSRLQNIKNATKIFGSLIALKDNKLKIITGTRTRTRTRIN